MGWLKRCFGIRSGDRRKDQSPDSIPAPIKVDKAPPLQRKKLGSFLLSKDEEEPASQEDTDIERLYRNLKLKTPAAVRKESSKEAEQSPSANDASSEFQSWPVCSFPEKLPQNYQHDELSISSVQLQQASINMEKDSDSFIAGHQIFETPPASFNMGKLLSTDGINNESDAETVVHKKSSSSQNELQMADEMQTSAAVCSTNLEHDKTGKDASIKLQHASTSGDKFVEYPANLQVVTGLSQWLKPPKSDSRVNATVNKSENSYSGKSSDADRPIIGMVAAHWTDVKPEPRPTKFWDGNGIPNSTHKYKEDQKVSWHATPFEERLEKALSSENSVPQRSPLSLKPIIHVEDQELIDTAAS